MLVSTKLVGSGSDAIEEQVPDTVLIVPLLFWQMFTDRLGLLGRDAISVVMRLVIWLEPGCAI